MRVRKKTAKRDLSRLVQAIVCGIFVFAGSANAQLVRKYSFQSLDANWHSIHDSTQEIPISWYLDAMTAGGEVVSAVGSQNGSMGQSRMGFLPPPGGGGSNGDGDIQPFLLSVYPLDPNQEAKFVSREVALGFYLNKMQFYEAPRLLPAELDGQALTPAQRDLLDENKDRNSYLEQVNHYRIYYANLELFAINLCRYKAAETIADKCRYAQKTLKYLNSALADQASVDPSCADCADARFEDLEMAFDEIANPATSYPYLEEIQTQIVCKMSPLPSLSESLAVARNEMDRKILGELSGGQIDTIIEQINTVLNSFSTLESQALAIQTHTKRVLELEQNIENAVSNFQMVKGDELEVEQKLERLATEVDLTLISNLQKVSDPENQDELMALGPLKGVTDAQQELATQIFALHNSLTSLATDIDDALVQQACANLGSADTADGEAFGFCIQSLALALEELLQPDVYAEKMQTFGQHLKHLSDEIINIRRNGS